MAHTPTTTHGLFAWTELMTSDPERAKSFYGPLLGWTFQTVPMPEGEYTMLLAGEKPAGGLSPFPAGESHPTAWASYVEVADVDRSAVLAGELGGSVLMGPLDVPEIGRMASVRDPEGAVLSLFKGIQAPSPPSDPPAPGTFNWFELLTRDEAIGRVFYPQVFGWGLKLEPMGPNETYVMFTAGELPVAGLRAMPAGVQGPAHWLPFVSVTDAADTLARVPGLGGQVIMGPERIPDVGWIGVLADPLGGVLAIWQKG